MIAVIVRQADSPAPQSIAIQNKNFSKVIQMMCLLTMVKENGEEKPAPVYIEKLISVELKDDSLLINGIVEIPAENLLEIKYRVKE